LHFLSFRAKYCSHNASSPTGGKQEELEDQEMKRALHSVLYGAIFLVALAEITPAAQGRSCSLANVAGRYGYTTSGSIPTLGAFAAVGAVTLEPSGNFSGTQTTSINGAVVAETVSGTYTVSADCTGAAIVNVFHGGCWPGQPI
jgi:hypothetical protein